MSLIKLPFNVVGEEDPNVNHGEVWVDPAQVAVVNLSFDRVHVGLRTGQMIHSRTPRLKTAVIENTPDHDTLAEWANAVVAMVNKAHGEMLDS
jgi:hypothetical protein